MWITCPKCRFEIPNGLKCPCGGMKVEEKKPKSDLNIVIDSMLKSKGIDLDKPIPRDLLGKIIDISINFVSEDTIRSSLRESDELLAIMYSTFKVKLTKDFKRRVVSCLEKNKEF